eukprot:g57673.t1
MQEQEPVEIRIGKDIYKHVAEATQEYRMLREEERKWIHQGDICRRESERTSRLMEQSDVTRMVVHFSKTILPILFVFVVVLFPPLTHWRRRPTWLQRCTFIPCSVRNTLIIT